MMQASGATPVALRTRVTYAGFWRRVLAYLIDAIVLGGLYFSLFEAVRILAPFSLDPGPLTVNGRLDSADFVAMLVPLANIAAVCGWIGWAYYVLLESSPARGTLGKIALGLYVADSHGDPITFVRAVVRNALKTLSSLLLGIGYVMAAFTPRKQGLHDLLSGTLVLRKTHYFVIGREAPSEPGEHWDGTRWVATVPPLENA